MHNPEPMALWMRLTLVTAAPDEIGGAAEGHRAQVSELGAAGRVRFAGTLARGDGYVEVFEAVDLLEAEKIANSSPLIEAGFASCILREIVQPEP